MIPVYNLIRIKQNAACSITTEVIMAVKDTKFRLVIVHNDGSVHQQDTDYIDNIYDTYTEAQEYTYKVIFKLHEIENAYVILKQWLPGIGSRLI
jgi:hypothetical protein